MTFQLYWWRKPQVSLLALFQAEEHSQGGPSTSCKLALLFPDTKDFKIPGGFQTTTKNFTTKPGRLQQKKL
jgi:hypothetical protein